jgi:hypothetical protein
MAAGELGSPAAFCPASRPRLTSMRRGRWTGRGGPSRARVGFRKRCSTAPRSFSPSACAVRADPGGVITKLVFGPAEIPLEIAASCSRLSDAGRPSRAYASDAFALRALGLAAGASGAAAQVEVRFLSSHALFRPSKRCKVSRNSPGEDGLNCEWRPPARAIAPRVASSR